MRTTFELGYDERKEFFVFYCSSCSKKLRVSKNFLSPASVIEAYENKCPECNSRLEESMVCKLIHDEQDYEPYIRKVRNVKAENLFVPASSFFTLKLGIKELDSAIGSISNGSIIVLKGKESNSIAELFSIRAQLPREKSGLDSSVVFVDGGNCSNIYLCSFFARKYCIEPRKALRRIITSRAFTIYQLENIVRMLPKVVNDYASRAVIVADVFGTLNEPELNKDEATIVINSIFEGIKAVKEMNVFVLLTIQKSTAFDYIARKESDVFIELREGRKCITAALLKHPYRKNTEFTINNLEDEQFGKDYTIVQDI